MSFALGLPPSIIENMAYSDYERFRRYRERKYLPFERFELYMANLLYMTAGNPKAKLKDFLLSDDFSQNRQPEKLDFDFSILERKPLLKDYSGYKLPRKRKV